MKLYQLLGDGQAEPEAAVQPRRGGITLSEALENVRQDLRGNADSRIGDRDLDVLRRSARRETDAPSRARELRGVRQDVPQHLLHAIRIAAIATDRRIDVDLQPDRLRLRRRTNHVDRGVDHCGQVHLFEPQVHFPRGDSGHIQEIFDERFLLPRTLVDDVQAPLGTIRRQYSATKHVDPAQHRVHRRP